MSFASPDVLAAKIYAEAPELLFGDDPKQVLAFWEAYANTTTI